MFMCFEIYNSNKLLDEFASLHLCENNITCKNTQCQIISRVSSVWYLGLFFDKILRWNWHVNNLVIKLRSLTPSFYNLWNVIPINTMRLVHLSIYQAIFRFGLLVWGGLNDNALYPLINQQKQILRICLRKGTLENSSKENFKTFNVLPVKLLYMKIYHKYCGL